MEKEEIIKQINDLIEKRMFSTMTETREDFINSSLEMNTTFRFELSNSQAVSQKYYFKVENLEQAKDIWKELVKGKQSKEKINTLFNQAVNYFNIDLADNLFLVIIIN